jgi:hypothetical protein
MDPSFLEYSVLGVTCKKGDVMQAYDCKNKVRFDFKVLDSYSSGWVLSNGKIVCNEDGKYDFYLKFKYENDMVYIGKAA